MVSPRVIGMSITLAVIIGIALPAMVQQVPAAERKSRKRLMHKPVKVIVPEALLAPFRNALNAHKVGLQAQLNQAMSTKKVLMAAKQYLLKATEQEKQGIAEALKIVTKPYNPDAKASFPIIPPPGGKGLRGPRTPQSPHASALMLREIQRILMNIDKAIQRIQKELLGVSDNAVFLCP